VWVRTRRSGWDKRQATIQLTIFADGVYRSRQVPDHLSRHRRQHLRPTETRRKLFGSRVVVKFNPKGYANNPIMLFWLEFMHLPVLGTGPTHLVMDLFKSHSTQSIKDWLRAHRITLLLFPAVVLGLFNLSMYQLTALSKIFSSRQSTTQLISLKYSHLLALYQPRDDRESIGSRQRVR